MNEKTLFKLGYGLYVLSAKDGKDNGCIVNTVMQITQVPIRIAVVVNKDNLTHDMSQKTKECNISILSESCPFDIFQRFGYQSGKTADKFEGCPDFVRSKNGLTYLTKGTNGFISCKVVNEVDCGSHTMFVAEMTEAEILNDETSVTYDYYQKNIKPKPEETKKTGWRCIICGYIYEGEELPADYICPLCKHGVADFEKL